MMSRQSCLQTNNTRHTTPHLRSRNLFSSEVALHRVFNVILRIPPPRPTTISLELPPEERTKTPPRHDPPSYEDTTHQMEMPHTARRRVRSRSKLRSMEMEHRSFLHPAPLDSKNFLAPPCPALQDHDQSSPPLGASTGLYKIFSALDASTKSSPQTPPRPRPTSTPSSKNNPPHTRRRIVRTRRETRDEDAERNERNQIHDVHVE